MWLNHLLLPGYTRRRARTMEHGRFTLRRNPRWCSDVFAIRCWNGEQVPVLFSLDCCNRVAMHWLATTGEFPARWAARAGEFCERTLGRRVAAKAKGRSPSTLLLAP